MSPKLAPLLPHSSTPFTCLLSLQTHPPSLSPPPPCPHPRPPAGGSAAGRWPPPGCRWRCSCPSDAGGRRRAGPWPAGGAGRGDGAAARGTVRPASAFAAGGSTAPGSSASETSPPPAANQQPGQGTVMCEPTLKLICFKPLNTSNSLTALGDKCDWFLRK